MYMYTHLHMCILPFLHKFIYIYMYIYIFSCLLINIFTYIHIFVYTKIHLHICTYIPFYIFTFLHLYRYIHVCESVLVQRSSIAAWATITSLPRALAFKPIPTENFYYCIVFTCYTTFSSPRLLLPDSWDVYCIPSCL